MATREDVHALFVQHRDRLHAFILAVTGRPADADDILQDVFLVAVDKAAEFAPGTDFLAWTRAIARFRILDQHAARRRLGGFDPDVAALLCDEAEREPDSWDEEVAALRDCLGQVAPGAVRLLRQRYESGLSAAEIASRSGRSPNGVAVALAKVRRFLRECIERRLRERGGTVAHG